MSAQNAKPAPCEQDQARLAGVRLAARTLDHHLTNDLSLTVGYAELIADDPELPERLRDLAHQALNSALAAVDTVRRLRRVESIQLVNQDLFDESLLKLGSQSVTSPIDP